MAASETSRLPRAEAGNIRACDVLTWWGLSWHWGPMGRAAQALGGRAQAVLPEQVSGRQGTPCRPRVSAQSGGVGRGRSERAASDPSWGWHLACLLHRRGRAVGPGSADRGLCSRARAVRQDGRRDGLRAGTRVLRPRPDQQRWHRLPVVMCPRGGAHQVTRAMTQWPGLERPPVLGARWRPGVTAAG